MRKSALSSLSSRPQHFWAQRMRKILKIKLDATAMQQHMLLRNRSSATPPVNFYQLLCAAPHRGEGVESICYIVCFVSKAAAAVWRRIWRRVQVRDRHFPIKLYCRSQIDRRREEKELRRQHRNWQAVREWWFNSVGRWVASESTCLPFNCHLQRAPWVINCCMENHRSFASFYFVAEPNRLSCWKKTWNLFAQSRQSLV